MSLDKLLNTVLTGNSRKLLLSFPSESIDCCITSPPYWGLRDYGSGKWIGGDPECHHRKVKFKSSDLQATVGTDGGCGIFKDTCKHCGAVRQDEQLGMEKTPEEYVRNMVDVFREVKRILKKDGTLWLNLGDTYMGGKGANGASKAYLDNVSVINKKALVATAPGDFRPNDRPHPFIKPKDLVGIPWSVAFALRDDGWYLRQDIVWSKPNCMPESVMDRCTKAHEYIFLLSKNRKYYFDYKAIQQPAKPDSSQRKLRANGSNHKWIDGAPGQPSHTMKDPRPNMRRSGNLERKDASVRMVPEDSGKNQAGSVPWEGDMANKRSVWEVPTIAFKGAHYATFPPDLIVDCIKAGCKENGVILDPFAGAGTAPMVARKLNRNFIGIELLPANVEMTDQRLYEELGMFK